MCCSLGPQPPPPLPLEFGRQFLEELQVAVATSTLAVQEGRQESDDAERTLVAVLFDDVAVCDLCNLFTKKSSWLDSEQRLQSLMTF